MKICFMDSGIGGLNVYNAFVNQSKHKHLVDEIIYFADYQNSPYGAKTKEELCDIMIQNVNNLYNKYKCNFFVIACNTATACCIEKLRKSFLNFVFVGIEPAVKKAKEAEGKTLVMSTSATYHYSKLLHKYRDDKDIYFLPLTNLSSIIDKYYDNQKKLNEVLESKLKYFKDKNIQNVVLGCTHYVYLKNVISKNLGKVSFFDSAGGVVKRIDQLLLDYKK